MSKRSEDDRADANWWHSLVELYLQLDGAGRVFCTRASDSRLGADAVQFIIEAVIAGNVASFLAIMGEIYERAGYLGAVDVGVAVTDIQNAKSYVRSQDFPATDSGYGAASYRRTERLAAAELVEPEQVTRRLLRDLFDATTARSGYDPFA